MNIRNLIGNFSSAILAQSLNMILSLITALIVPKILNVESYGYWQLFIFYSNYVGFFHLGLCDGIYLINGGKSEKQLNASSLKSQFFIGLLYQSLFAILIALYGLTDLSNQNRLFVVIMTAVFLLINNSFLYFGYLLQAINETRKYSAGVAIYSLCYLIPLIVFVIVDIKSFEWYIGINVIAKLIGLGYLAFYNRNIFTSKLLPVRQGLRESRRSISVGIKLMLANIANMLILGLLQWFVDFNWDIETFSYVSFAISLCGFIFVFISQASMVLFPALRQLVFEEFRSFYIKLRAFLNIVLPCIFLLYWPIEAILTAWLPQYSESMRLFILLMPICLFNGKMDILGATLLKVLRKEKSLLAINIATFLLSLALCSISVFVFRSLTLLVLSAVVSIIARSIAAELYSYKHFKIRLNAYETTNLLLPVALSVVFIAVNHYLAPSIGWLVMLPCCAASVFIQRSSLIEFIAVARRKLEGRRRRK